MSVEIQLFGFGSEKPPSFGESNRHQFDVTTPATPLFLLETAGIEACVGLLLMREDSVIPAELWRQPIVQDGDQLTLMFAIEGG